MIESGFELDLASRAGAHKNMTKDNSPSASLQLLVLERRDEDRNMKRFYVLSIEPTLFGDTALVREWGRLGMPGRRCIDHHAKGILAQEALGVWLSRKLRRGYVLT